MNLNSIFEDRNDPMLFYRGHVIYGIHNIVDDLYYIGKTDYSLYYRFLDSWYPCHYESYKWSEDKLYYDMRRLGPDKFEVIVLSTDPNAIEKTYITKYDSFNHGYNKTPDGLGFDGEFSGRTGKVIYHTPEGKEVMVNLKYEDHVLKLHPEYIKGRLTPWTYGVTIINDGYKEYKVNNEDLEKVLASNPELKHGRLPSSTTSGRKHVYDPNYGFMLIKMEECEEYFLNHPGSHYLHPNKGRIHLHDSTGDHTLPTDKLADYLLLHPDAVLGHSYNTMRGRKAFTNGEYNVLLYDHEIENFLANNPGFRRGQTHWINPHTHKPMNQ